MKIGFPCIYGGLCAIEPILTLIARIDVIFIRFFGLVGFEYGMVALWANRIVYF